MEKEVTIYDLAHKLEISPATVSRALQDHPAISKKTKKKIFELAEEMGYRTNNFARNLRNKNTNTIGVIVPRLDSYFMSTVIAGIENTAGNLGYQIIISQSSEQVKKEASSANTLFNSRVDGLLVSLAYDTEDLSHFDIFLKKKVPIIFFDRVTDYDGCMNILIDNRKAANEATRHLIQQGCRRLVHLTAIPKRNVYIDRLEGFKQALEEAGLPYSEDQVIIDNLSQEAGVRAAEIISKMKPLPDGVFVSNDNCATVCMITLKKMGIRIPEDIAFVGFNNDPVCKVAEPNLTTINYPGYEMGQVAARSLISHLSGAVNIHATTAITLRADLIVRASSMRIKSS
ncbi:LacI family transcriptional regulator [Chitinophagaceae bacterium LB-8]|uniref:LacI family transcriptional regulator n=1 Tax=Paraflavisolibacter caeni TaxID=2982496 RepID=A0A9X2XW37_9BACT|nr:LacI family DNA-binding transcriptional regulator [Paraflavisolibacter caeni]MCU7550140.1 LacI family transcriptional regulator [Paraflavisolibacter caeni]